MIGWLQGNIKHRFQRGSRSYALIVTGEIGYEVQLIQRDWSALITERDYERWVHQVVSAESLQLFGASIAERISSVKSSGSAVLDHRQHWHSLMPSNWKSCSGH